MVAAIITGVLLGLISVIPFKVATKKIRTINPANSLSLLGPFLLTIALSFLILIAGMIVCKFVAADGHSVLGRRDIGVCRRGHRLWRILVEASVKVEEGEVHGFLNLREIP